MAPEYVVLTLIGEMLFTLLVLVTSLYCMGKYYKGQIKRLLQLKSNSKTEAGGEAKVQGNPILEFLSLHAASSKNRYRKLTSKDAICLVPTAPVSQQVASIRNVYLEAEKQVCNSDLGDTSRWSLLEKEIKKIIDVYRGSKIIEKKDNENLKTQNSLLRERIEKLEDDEQSGREAEEEFLETQDKTRDLGSVEDISHSHMIKLQNLNRKLSICGDTIGHSSGDVEKITFHENNSADNVFQNIKGTNERSGAKISLLQEKINDQKETILDLKKSLRDYGLKLEISEHKNSRNESALVNLEKIETALSESNTAASSLQFELDKVKGAWEIAERQISKLKEEKKRIEKEKSNANKKNTVDMKDENTGEDSSFTVVSKKEEDKSIEDMVEPVALEAIECYSRAKDELDRLRDGARGQRGLILELENELTKLKEELSHGSHTEEELEGKNISIEKLEKLLKESDDCIFVLESEIDRLNKEMEVLSEIGDQKGSANSTGFINGDEKVEAEGDIEHIKSDLDKSGELLEQAIKAYDDQSHIIQFAFNSLACSNYEQLAKEVMDIAQVMGIKAGLQIRVASGEIEVSNTSAIAKKEFRQLVGHEYWLKNGFTEVEDGLIFVLKNLAFLAKFPVEDKKKVLRLKETLNSILSLANFTIDKIQNDTTLNTKRQNLKMLIDSTKKNMKQLTVQNKYQGEEASRIVSRLVEELNASLSNMGFSDNQKMLFTGMMQDTQERMALLFASGIVLDKSFGNLIGRLDEVE